MAIPARLLRPLVLALLLAPLPAGSHAPAVISGMIAFDEHAWGRGTIPTLTFTVSAGRGEPRNVFAYLYFSDVPGAFENGTYPRQFIGILSVPGSIVVDPFIPPTAERGPVVTAQTGEVFVQGAFFDDPGAPLPVGVTNEEYFDVIYDQPPVEFFLDMQTEDDFTTGLVNGQDISSPPEFGQLVSVSALQPGEGVLHHGPAIFDSDPEGPNINGDDQDLLVDLGNILILQGDGEQEVPGIFAKPDDARDGGTLVFDFTGFEFIEKVEPLSIDLVNIDDEGQGGAVVTLTDVLDRQRTYTVPRGWTEDITRQGPPGARTLDLTTLDPQPGFLAVASASEEPGYIPGEVVRLEVELGGEGAVDALRFQREADPGHLPGALRGAQGPGGPSGSPRR